ncbi:hypothetical protein L2E82_36506 [Cichorium intybus]|uniref:Uncharacterized protein n=1 Tax=Cichorium intybus TaxID=13427 RepID=A0ACB9BS24_CICIN|nr:hypothetical protein L2E82_36506 [Cichorium intybus]
MKGTMSLAREGAPTIKSVYVWKKIDYGEAPILGDKGVILANDSDTDWEIVFSFFCLSCDWLRQNIAGYCTVRLLCNGAIGQTGCLEECHLGGVNAIRVIMNLLNLKRHCA